MNQSEIMAAQQAELELLREKVTGLTNRANEIATAMGGLVVAVSIEQALDRVRVCGAFYTCCGLLGYDWNILVNRIQRELTGTCPEDLDDISTQILSEVLEGTYLQEEADAEADASDSASG